MTDMAIDAKGFVANARSEPRFGSNVVAVLQQNELVTVTGNQQGDRWLPCNVEIDSSNAAVFVSKNVLRDTASPAKERLLQTCVAEWFRFERERGKEHLPPWFRFVGEYWDSIGMDLDGKDRDVPWSAAYISFCIRNAGGYSGFKFAAAHARYVNQAIRRRLDGTNGPFWGFRINEHKPQLGDMVCRSRANSGVSFDFAAENDAFKSHCDIVVRVEKNRVVTLGGNVSHTVKRTPYKLRPGGFLDPDGGRVYAVLRNNK